VKDERDISLRAPGDRPTGVAAPSWVEIDGAAYRRNLSEFRSLAGPATRLMAVVKANAYGHGMDLLAPIAARSADALGVNSLDEALKLLGAAPIHVLGPLSGPELEEAATLPLDVTLSTMEGIEALARGARRHGTRPRCHVKVETGCHRQGFGLEEMDGVAGAFAAHPELRWVGLATHFANIEDTTDHSYGRRQLRVFLEAAEALGRRGVAALLRHAACTAATIVMPETHLDMVRIGIGSYGLWPSRETLVSAQREHGGGPKLQAVLSWKTRIAQVKWVDAQAYVGYGCTYRTTRRTRLAVLPVGYCDGYDRGLSNSGRVLVRGRRAPVLGRVCMNMTMVDVTDIDGAGAGDEVVLLGSQGDEALAAHDVASLCNTIVYEITSRIAATVPRILSRAADGS